MSAYVEKTKMWMKHWQQRWLQDHCHDQVTRSSISGKYEIFCREKEIFFDRNEQLFYHEKFNGNFTVVHDSSST